MEKESENVKKPSEDKAKKGEYSFGRVVLVQAAVCAFLIILVLVSGKLSPKTYDYIKAEFNSVMSKSLDAGQVVDSVMGAARGIMETPTAEENEKTEENQEENNGEGGEDLETQDTAVAVMASLGKKGRITPPIHGTVTSEYGYRVNPISGKYTLHTGVDIAAPMGTGIAAAYNGVVRETGNGEKKGNYVLMLHEDGSQTLYCHCSKILVEEGTVIRAGELIALVGSTGWSTGPHLHFEMRVDDKTVDPLTVLTVKDGKV